MVALACTTSAQGPAGKIPTFEDPRIFAAGSFPWGLDSADAVGRDGLGNNTLDGYPDLAVVIGNKYAGQDTPGGGHWVSGTPSVVVIYRNLQDWEHTAGLVVEQVIALTEMSETTVAADVAWADMDDDGRLDLVISASHHFDNEAEPSAWGVYIYLYEPTQGEFLFDHYESTPLPVRSIVVADIDNQAGPDVLAVPDHIYPPANADVVFAMLNDGTGALLPPSTSTVGDVATASPTDLAAGHFNRHPGGTAYPDVVTSKPYTNSAVLQTNTARTFSVGDILPCTSLGFWDYGIGKFTLGDLSDDVAGIGADGTVYVLHGDAEGGFTGDCGAEPNDVYLDEFCGCNPGPTDAQAFALDTGHLNGGTKIDIAATDLCNNIRFVLGRGDGKFAHNCYQVDSGVSRLVQTHIVDLNLDGFGDIVSVGHGNDPNEGEISVLINKLLVAITP